MGPRAFLPWGIHADQVKVAEEDKDEILRDTSATVRVCLTAALNPFPARALIPRIQGNCGWFVSRVWRTVLHLIKW
jgi:hypothetical protein